MSATTQGTAVGGRRYVDNEATSGTSTISPAKPDGACVVSFTNRKGRQVAVIALAPDETVTLDGGVGAGEW